MGREREKGKLSKKDRRKKLKWIKKYKGNRVKLSRKKKSREEKEKIRNLEKLRKEKVISKTIKFCDKTGRGIRGE